MGNGRSFSRKRKGSPNKSRRRQAAKQRSAWAMQKQMDDASKRLTETVRNALSTPGLDPAAEKALDDTAADLAKSSGMSEEDARVAVVSALNSFVVAEETADE